MQRISFTTPNGKTEYIYEGMSVIEENPDILCLLGTKALIVTGKTSAEKNGSLQDVKNILSQNGIGWVHFNEVEENPSVETIIAAAKYGIENDVDFVIGIGGGSPMDAAKAIAVMIANPDKGWEYLFQPADGELKHLQVIAVPTTCGTGSEVTGVAVLTRNDLKTKASMSHRVFPTYALIDPKYLKSAGLSIIRNTYIDSLGHMIESYVGKAQTKEGKAAVESGLCLWKELKERLLLGHEPDGKPFSDETYEKLMMQSYYAGVAIAFGGTSMPHSMSYHLTYELHMQHGVAVGYFLAGFLKVMPEEERGNLLSMIGFESAEELDAYYKALCEPNEVSEAMLLDAVTEAASVERKLKGAVFDITKETVMKIAGL